MKQVYFSPTNYSKSKFDGATHTADVSFYRNLADSQHLMEFLYLDFDEYRSRGYDQGIMFTTEDLMDFFAWHSFEHAHKASLDPRNNGFSLLVIDNITQL
jgi:hypothetical protein